MISIPEFIVKITQNIKPTKYRKNITKNQTGNT